jgi:hypothetical protein
MGDFRDDFLGARLVFRTKIKIGGLRCSDWANLAE